MLSTRHDIFSFSTIKELSFLRNKVKIDKNIEIYKYIEKKTKKKISSWLIDLRKKPFSSASIAQIYCAKLKKNKKRIIIKVIRTDIVKNILIDTKLIENFIKISYIFSKKLKKMKILDFFLEYKKILFDELDLIKEKKNIAIFRKQFKNSKLLYIPKVYDQYCTKEILVMERIFGIPIDNLKMLRKKNFNMRLLAEKGVKIFFEQVFQNGIFHADMHPGNVFVSKYNPRNPKYISIDFGIVGKISSKEKRYLAENFLAFLNKNYKKIVILHIELGLVKSTINTKKFEIFIKKACEPFFQQSISNISFSNFLIEIFRIVQKFNVIINPKLFLLQKTIFYIEGLGKKIYPKLNIWEIAKPIVESWIFKEMNFFDILKTIVKKFKFLEKNFSTLQNFKKSEIRKIKNEKEKKIFTKIEKLFLQIKIFYQICIFLISFLLIAFFLKNTSIF
ncbi:AarF/UbiB family protein [bacterium endosymbiont of Pedicinus badii]|uniref:AarF/UbiB family protein n=1 Tax=bacterium endosymbiont of Pedicinus badii TaxID=1719126 RepID=UPI0009BA273C|nr:AarF/UbiB family protein [bacterium endosymbiont of Pedicinus badii]OQM34084.1 hypothetical protein AOQ89_01880 [bacterium endosymbiont of Pedicinus badii]